MYGAYSDGVVEAVKKVQGKRNLSYLYLTLSTMSLL